MTWWRATPSESAAARRMAPYRRRASSSGEGVRCWPERKLRSLTDRRTVVRDSTSELVCRVTCSDSLRMTDAQITRLDGIWGNNGLRGERAERAKRDGGAGVLDTASLLTGRTGSLESLHSQVSLVSPTPTPWGSTVSLSNSSVNYSAGVAPATEGEGVTGASWARGSPSGTGAGEMPLPEGLGGVFGGSTGSRNVELSHETLGANKVNTYSTYSFGAASKAGLGTSALPTTYEDSVPSYLLQEGHELKAHDIWAPEDTRDVWGESTGNSLHSTQAFSVPRLGERWNPRPFLAPLQSTGRSGMAPLPPRRCASFAALPSDSSAPVAASFSANTAKLVLEELRQEKVILENMKERVPRVWLLLCAEIHRVQEILQQYCANASSDDGITLSRNFSRNVPESLGAPSNATLSGNSNGTLHLGMPRSSSGSFYNESTIPVPVAHSASDSIAYGSGLLSDATTQDTGDPVPLTRAAIIAGASSESIGPGVVLPVTASNKAHGRNIIKKRCRVSVPADQYPDYNFVGRLLGPRGATLKKLERETGCKIMIRGKGSIRKDKESEVRGKPGWEHVFSEPLHVILEAEMEESQADYALERAKELVELLLIPVPEDRDTLKREQLRELAILNGTLRCSWPGNESGSAAPTTTTASNPGTSATEMQLGLASGRRTRRSLSTTGAVSAGTRSGAASSGSAGSPQSNNEYRIFGLGGSLGNLSLSDMNG
ncbi:hypothetical protein F1559_001328 [Cyanidiococcus yangmingshanensis]|uniref:K Homology domain-containing protein n=1 Tax=Cyanidiococcus yangmingshanensis TaxID=2690220 RepID=A0A7J7IBG4_9RHOD|nr:hypothetical protein F1559_001328 [Cyanidiococcus yangmingshanensis]